MCLWVCMSVICVHVCIHIHLYVFYVIVGICKIIIFLEDFFKQPCFFMPPTSSVLTSLLPYLPQTPFYISLPGF